jgi:glycosyltransferase involved in cell wall biosynthesis
MIVKNEAKVIQRMLSSVKPIIDTFCICDTGSTDDTVQLIESFGAEHCIPGTIVHTEFVNFEQARTFAIRAAQENSDADYLLLMDADMVLKIDEKFDKASLRADVIKLKQGTTSFYYENPRLVRRTITCCYVGVTHEYLSISQPDHSSALEKQLFINDIGDGGCKSDKSTRDIQLLLDGIEKSPANERYHFYLANTYHDIHENEKAIEYYKKRVALGGWAEEVYYSLFRICVCYRRMGDIDHFLFYGMKAWQYRPSRAESIYELMKHYKETKNHKMVTFLYQLVKDLPVPSDSLFVHASVYQHQMHNELTQSAFYCGLRGDVYQSFRHLFDHYDVYTQFQNYKFYYPVPQGCVTSLACEHYLDGMIFRGSSPSIVALDYGTYLVNIRLVNYTIRPDGSSEYSNKTIATRNKQITLGPQLQVLDEAILAASDERRLFPYNTSHYISGIEDVKLMNYDGVIYYTGTKLNAENRIGVCYGVYGNPLAPTELMNHTSCEKNWVFVPGKENHLRFIYKWRPLVTGTIDGRELKLTTLPHTVPKLFEQARGSTNGVLWKGNYWFVVHFVHKYAKEPRFYYHALVVLDPTLKPVRYSMPFKMSSTPIEYCLGVVIEDSRILLSCSKNDCDSYIGVYPHNAFHFIEV